MTTDRASKRRAAREAARRRQAANILRIAASTATYGAAAIGNGISPEEARATAQFVATELVSVAEALRRLTRPPVTDRRAAAAELRAEGLSTKQIAQTIGVSDRAVRYYLRGRACP